MAFEKSGGNIGSLCKIELIENSKVVGMPTLLYGELQGQVTLGTGAAWENIYFTEDSAHFVEKAVAANGAEYFALVVNWKVPKDKVANQKYVLELKNKRYLARLTDTNGVVTIAGTPDEPCRVIRSLRDKGQNARDSNHYIMELRLTRMEPVPIQTV